MKYINAIHKKISFKNFNLSNVTVFTAIAIFVIFFVGGSLLYKGFFSMQILLNLFIDNAHLLIVTLGETMVFIVGGIDLSGGAIIALGSVVAAHMITVMHLPVPVAVITVMLIGMAIGYLSGYLIAYKNFPPFIATLATMYLARGLSYMISTNSIVVTDPTFIHLSLLRLKLFGSNGAITFGVIVAILIFLIYHFMLRYTKFGRNVYAVGGNQQSSILMGLPHKRIKMQTYMLAGLTSSIAGLVFLVNTLSGYALNGMGLELDAISSTIIGGTLTTGGVGLVFGSVFGVMTNGIIQTLISFQGTLASWWTRIIIAVLLLVFVLIQRFIVFQRERSKVSKNVETLNS
jgi:ribose/xylose/arabinose/galactoside ABC-type transport system permease subunit